MEIVNKVLNKTEFKQYVKDYDFGTIPPNRIVLHHTWKPRIEDWKGQASIDGLKRYYEGKGWQTAPHLFIAPDGIWLFTPFYDVGIHAGTGNATYKNKYTGKIFNGYIGNKGAGNWLWKLQSYSIGIEMVGDYDAKKPSGKILDFTLFAIKTLMERLNMKHDALHFHRDYSTKTCPGAAVTKEWIYKKLDEYGKPAQPITGVPKYFKENFVWDPDKELTYDEVVRMLWKYHKTFNDKP